MKYYSFWFGLLPLACVALGAKAHSSTIAEAVGEDNRTIYIRTSGNIGDVNLAVWANSAWTNINKSVTKTIGSYTYYTVDIPMTTTSMTLVRPTSALEKPWTSDEQIYNKTSDIDPRGYNAIHLSGYGEGKFMNWSGEVLNIAYETEAPTKRIFLDRGTHYANVGDDYVFVTQGYFFKTTDYVMYQENNKYLAYFDIPLDLLTAIGKTFFFSIYQDGCSSYKGSTNVTSLSYDQAKVFYHNAWQTIERKVMYTGDEEAVEEDYREAVYNRVLADINPCDNSTAYKDYIGCGTLDDLEMVWHLDRRDRHGLGLSKCELNGSTEYVDGSHGETVITKLRTMYSNSTKGSTFVAAKANEANDTSMVTITVAAIALGVSAAIFFGIRKRRDNA